MSPLWWLALPIVLVAAACWIASLYLTSRRRHSVFHTPAEYGLQYEELRFTATDGLRLRGCWIPPPREPAPAVIILHGHGGSLDGDLHRAPALHEAGYGVFLLDFRAHGASEGRVASFGYLERRDVQGAVELLTSRGVRSIGLLGFSYGGIASMLAAPICPEVRAVVTDGGPTRLRTAVAGRATELHIPRGLSSALAWLIVGITSLRLGTSLSRYDTVRWVGRIAPRPVFFIHGEDDTYCPDFDDLWEAAGDPKELWRLPGVGHTKASELYPEEFYRRVIGFFDRTLR